MSAVALCHSAAERTTNGQCVGTSLYIGVKLDEIIGYVAVWS